MNAISRYRFTRGAANAAGTRGPLLRRALTGKHGRDSGKAEMKRKTKRKETRMAYGTACGVGLR